MRGSGAHIFDRYFHTTAQTKHKSSGLGLTIARELTLLHSGTLSVESEPARGITFIARFPLLADEEKTCPRQEKTPDAGRKCARRVEYIIKCLCSRPERGQLFLYAKVIDAPNTAQERRKCIC